MTALSPLRDRHLKPGRGRVYMLHGRWFADYRALNGALYMAWDDTPEVVYAWIQKRASR